MKKEESKLLREVDALTTDLFSASAEAGEDELTAQRHMRVGFVMALSSCVDDLAFFMKANPAIIAQMRPFFQQLHSHASAMSVVVGEEVLGKWRGPLQ